MAATMIKENHQATNKMKNHQVFNNLFLLNNSIKILLTCSLLCCGPLWIIDASLYQSMKLFLFVLVPKTLFSLVTTKFLFIIGNLIVIVLIGESKLFPSNYTPSNCDLFYDECINRKGNLCETEETSKVEKCFEGNVGTKMASCIAGGVSRQKELWGEKRSESFNDIGRQRCLSADELNRRADAFIARVNRQRRLEARLIRCYSRQS